MRLPLPATSIFTIDKQTEKFVSVPQRDPITTKLKVDMIYKVKARIIEERIGEFYRKLADGTIAKQRPDGEEITASMKRAVLTAPGVAEWYEKCFCPTPLQHERRTQYDFYFTDMTTREAEGYGEFKGESLWDYMASKAGAAGHA